MRYKGKINKLNHIIISDPSYDKDVTCRYEKENLREKNWTIDIEINSVVEKIEDFTCKGVEFFLFLCKDKQLGELKEKGTISYLRGVRLKEYKIGMDTACVAIGINEKAKEIVESRDCWQPEMSLNTLTDGYFGVVKEGIFGRDEVFIFMSGYLSEDTGYTIEDIIDYLQYQLNITELQKENDKEIVNDSKLEKEEKNAEKEINI